MKKYLLFLVLLLIMFNVDAQSSDLTDRLHAISTLVTATLGGNLTQGSGFFFEELEKKPEKLEGQWLQTQNTWLVTNRHVVLLKDVMGKEQIPETFTFQLRKRIGTNIVWEPITLKKEELVKRLKLHKDNTIDIAIIDILDLLKDKVAKDKNILAWQAVRNSDFPGNNKMNVEVADDVITLSYPRGFYDEFNVFPIVKSGIVSSVWGANFNGKPYFLIDSKLFPGSSGSIVLSKPTNTVMDQGQMFFSKSKQFAFLGVYSEEPFNRPSQAFDAGEFLIQQKQGFNLGIVWYPNLILEIIKEGVVFK